jgi:hypothetical protein
VEKTFDAVDSKENISRWMGGEIQTKFLSDHDPKNPVGTKFTHTVQKLVTIEGEVIAYEKPKLLGVHEKYKNLTGTVFHYFKPVGENVTELTCVIDIPEEKTWQTVLIKTLKPLFDQMVAMQLRGIKNIAEETKV